MDIPFDRIPGASSPQLAALDAFLPAARMVEIDHVDVGAPIDRAWDVVRHADLGAWPLARALFALREVPARLRGERPARASLRLDDLGAGSEPGFRVLSDRPYHFVVGAIGRVWEKTIPFRDVAGDRFAAFDEPGWAKVAWELRAEPRGPATTRVTVEVRVSATDDDAWLAFRRYFALIGPFSRLIRHHLLHALAGMLGTPADAEQARALPGDDVLPAAKAHATHAVTIDAPPEAIWPWLVQMGAGRAGWYSHDRLDNGGAPSATRIEPALQDLHVGDLLRGTPSTDDGFVVMRLEPNALLLLGGRYDLDAGRQIPSDGPPPAHFWQVTWAFVLEPIDARSTRLLVRVRVDFAPERVVWHARAMALVHGFMERAQLRNLKARVEGAFPGHADSVRDVADGAVGAPYP